MITTILFDLDGTLLPMDLDVLLKAYLGGLAAKAAPLGYEPEAFTKNVWAATKAMICNDGSETNEAVFWRVFSRLSQRNALQDKAVFDSYYLREYENLRQVCGFDPRASEVIRMLKEHGLRLVLATQPLFPATAAQSRVRWAGLEPSDFALITSYENSRHSKPNPDYYRDILAELNLKPEECVMVGNDVTEDMVAQTLGLQVFLLTDCLINKSGADISAYPHGSFPELMEYLQSIL
jgi:FMN phosphatase YigB (HAD superfamily)